MIAEGVGSCGVPIQGALCDAEFCPLQDRKNPPNPTMNVYRSSDDSWFVLIALPSKLKAMATGIGRPDLLSDARFADPAKLATNSAALTASLDEVLASRPTT